MDWLAFIEKMLASCFSFKGIFLYKSYISLRQQLDQMKIVRTLVKPASLHVAFSTVPSQQSAV